MKRAAKEEPVVGIVEVLDPVQIRLALRAVPPHIARLLVAIKDLCEMSSVPPSLEYSRD